MQKILLILAILISLILGLALAAPVLVPERTAKMRLETVLSETLGRDVRIGGLRFRLLPRPWVELRDVRMRGGTGENEMDLGKVVVRADLSQLLHHRSPLRRVEIRGVRARAAAVEPLLYAGPGSGGEPLRLPFGIREADIHDFRLLSRRHRGLGPYDLNIRVDGTSALRELRLQRTDGTLQATVAPGENGLRVIVDARHWKLPLGPPAPVRSMHLLGTMRGPQLRVQRLQMDCFGGQVTGRLWLGWGEHWTLEANLDLDGVDTGQAFAAYGQSWLRGTLSGRAHVILDARDPDHLLGNPIVEADVSVADGALQRADLGRAAASGEGRRESGGSTPFTRLSGRVAVQLGAVHLTGLRLSAPGLKAFGRLRVDPARDLDGLMEVGFAGAPGGNGVAVKISGDAARPVLTHIDGYGIDLARISPFADATEAPPKAPESKP